MEPTALDGFPHTAFKLGLLNFDAHCQSSFHGISCSHTVRENLFWCKSSRPAGRTLRRSPLQPDFPSSSRQQPGSRAAFLRTALLLPACETRIIANACELRELAVAFAGLAGVISAGNYPVCGTSEDAVHDPLRLSHNEPYNCPKASWFQADSLLYPDSTDSRRSFGIPPPFSCCPPVKPDCRI